MSRISTKASNVAFSDSGTYVYADDGMDSGVMSTFAQTILRNKEYTHSKGGGNFETWPEAAERVVRSVMGPYLPDMVERTLKLVIERKFVPAGRYLYASGRRSPMVNNCFLFKCVEDSRQEWGRIADHSINALMCGGGVGVVYSGLREEEALIGGLGGRSTGPCALMRMVNENGRYIRQGGSRRSAIWAGLHWWHKDIFKFIELKDWSDSIRRMREVDFNFPAPMDGTNVSVILDDEFFSAYNNEEDPRHDLAANVYWTSIRHMLRTGEPGFSIDIGENRGENLRNAPVHGDTQIMTRRGYERVVDIVDRPTTVWTGKQWAEDVVFKKTGEMVKTVRVTMTGGREIVCDPSHPFLVEDWQGRGQRRKMVGVERVPAGELQEGDILHVSLPEETVDRVDNDFYTLGFLYGDGSFTKRGSAEVTICTAAKAECLGRLCSSFDHTRTKDGRGYIRIFYKQNDYFCGLTKTKLLSPSNPDQAAGLIAGLFDADGNVDLINKRVRFASMNREFIDDVARLLETLGILSHVTKAGISGYSGREGWQLVVASDSTARFLKIIPTIRVRFDIGDYKSYRKSTIKVIAVTPDKDADVYCADVRKEEHSFCAEGVIISNCTEVTSSDDQDMCNLGSINMGRLRTPEEFREVVECGTAFLICGTLYSKLPLPGMYKTREKNRRIGLGLMGVHEWLLRRGMRYGPCEEMSKWLNIYKDSGAYANRYADRLGISRPIATRSIAPTGTISIIAETTSGIEPIYAVAYKRRYLEGIQWKAQYVIDAAAKRLIDAGVNPNLIEDAYTLAEDVERRVGFQVWLQERVDHGISSTLNTPPWGSSLNNESTVTQFGRKLLNYLPQLRGITTYPDGSRGGQPLNRVPYTEAVKHVGHAFVEESEHGNEQGCKNGVCGE